jgi:xanthine dehydrogenase accessory factor
VSAVVEVVVLEAKGSAPREAGARMRVSAKGIEGTIGGGNLEWSALKVAREMLLSGEARRERVFALGDSLGQCCGGTVKLDFTLVPATAASQDRAGGQAAEFEVVLFGAGHVGKELARILERLPCRLTWVDPRPDAFPPAVGASVRALIEDEPAFAVDDAPAGAFFVVMTYSHALDLELVERVLGRGDFAYLGLIGSETKAAKFRARLRARGVPEERLARLVSPIGAVRGGKHPAAVAVSVAAQLLEVAARRAAAASRDPGATRASRPIGTSAREARAPRRSSR